ncbi:RNA polymerase sigma-70 factor (ECF subfamily) [Filimonas zeae]|uniref:RNA polymerase sigma factor n=1 Tax=Filimonas zeae TaxID=1737353 RepID=A0A917IQE1_9BACT|nr:sigma-70 family RNA polymerase sigma factor [Filimonas zeae]MDR6337602.1 RNA polymerase sigma-70 factor (ECF subfamily) [Filimonas zeae]GGH59402.1 RNA polymerase sigma factor [Filimonas zeae]
MTVDKPADSDLWLQVKQGNGPAFKNLFNQYWEKLYVYAHNRLKSEADAQDVVQNVMIGLWTRRATVTIETTLAAYLHAAVQYEVLRHLARVSRMAERKTELEATILPEFIGYIDPLHLKELQALAEDEISRLPEKMQQVYRLHQQENLSVKEIAQLLNTSEQTVRNQLNTSYQKLRKHLKEAFLAAAFLQGF